MNFFKKISESLNKLYTKALMAGGQIMYRRVYRELLQLHPNKNKSGIKEYIKKWKPLIAWPDRSSFLLFSQYIGPNPNIVPEDISSSIIQPLLNPIEYRPYYSDKNCFEKILSPEDLPKTIFRMIKGGFYHTDYSPIKDLSKDLLNELTSNLDCIFIKPSVDSSSGHDVYCFKRDSSDKLFCKEIDKSFNLNFLNNYSYQHKDFIVQKGLLQSSYLSQFNSTSINTLRVATYKSIKDNKSHVCSIILRIGKSGTSVDNAHAGGLFVGVERNGQIGKFACDQFGKRYESFNGINFKNNSYKIPNFDKVISFAESIGDKILHHRLIAQDICIKADGKPCLVEYNIGGFSTWLFQFTIGPAFGEFTDEIIEYCRHRKKDINKVFIEPF